jgi:SnoaL-like domain
MTLHDGKQRVEGLDDIMQLIGGSGALSASTHWIANQLAAFDGDLATLRTFAVAVLADAHQPRIRVRGLEYDDDVIRTSEGWRITHRRHRATWQFYSEALPTNL